MEEGRRERFALVMAVLGEVYRTDLTETMIEVYYEVLAKVPIDKIEENARHHMENEVFFPKPIELRQKSGVNMAHYHQLYVPPWKGETRWKGLPEGRDDVKQIPAQQREEHGEDDSEGGHD